ncbi:MAG TPA: hypothetical protein VHV77_06440, partial [Pirellulales bacterium]|nr:hypothetical protein [Pirellulales bacterium]
AQSSSPPWKSLLYWSIGGSLGATKLNGPSPLATLNGYTFDGDSYAGDALDARLEGGLVLGGYVLANGAIGRTMQGLAASQSSSTQSGGCYLPLSNEPCVYTSSTSVEEASLDLTYKRLEAGLVLPGMGTHSGIHVGVLKGRQWNGDAVMSDGGESQSFTIADASYIRYIAFWRIADFDAGFSFDQFSGTTRLSQSYQVFMSVAAPLFR